MIALSIELWNMIETIGLHWAAAGQVGPKLYGPVVRLIRPSDRGDTEVDPQLLPL